MHRSPMRAVLAGVVSAALAVMSAQADGAAKSGGLLADEVAGTVPQAAAPGDLRSQ